MPESKREAAKPQYFRVGEDTTKEFRQLCDDLGVSQDQGLARLLETFQYQEAKERYPDRKSVIESFEGGLARLSEIFMGAVEGVSQTEERVRAGMAAILESKDQMALQLQEAARKSEEGEAEAKRALAAAQEKAALAECEKEDQVARLTEKITQASSHLCDKDMLVEALQRQAEDLRLQLEAAKGTEAAIRELEGEREALAVRLKQTERTLEEERLSMGKEMLEAERAYQAEIRELERAHRLEREAMQERYLELISQFKALEAKD